MAAQIQGTTSPSRCSPAHTVGSQIHDTVAQRLRHQGVLGRSEVAVKKLHEYLLIEDKTFLEEIDCLMRTKHRNIVQFLGYCADTQGKVMKHEGKLILADIRERLLCFEYIGNGSLQSKLKDTNCRLEWYERYKIIKGICQGLRYLHEDQNIVHLDLKPDNILLDREMVPKITDFGISRLFDEQQSRIITKSRLGSLAYMAPEYKENGEITFKSDIYSFGVIILEILTGKKERCGVENVVENWRNRLQATLSQLLLEAYCHQVKTCAEIALNCVQDDSQNRPDIGAIITKLNETETDFEGQENSTSFNLLEIHPLELRFPFELNSLATCPLYLANSTDDRIAFRVRPGNPERYFTEWLCGVVEPRSTYTLTVTMKEQKQHPPLDKDEFLIQQSRILDGNQLNNIDQGEADVEFSRYFEEVIEIGVDSVHELTLMALCDPEVETTSKVISTVFFDKMVSMDVHPAEPWIVTGHFNGHVCMWNYKTKEASDRMSNGVRDGFNTLVVLGAWTLWKARNEMVFNGIAPRVDRTIRRAQEELELWILAGAKGLGAIVASRPPVPWFGDGPAGRIIHVLGANVTL